MPNDDSRLLAAYLHRADPEAFAALVAKLGPAVLRVCRTVLDDDHLAEDAFQATFLVLFRKASEIEDPERLRGWLCGTAYKTAARLRRRAIRLADRERPTGLEAAEERSPTTDHDVFVILREELEHLPEKYRAPLILCYLEGLTHQQAAEHLGWATGTVKVRLMRGKRQLRERLDRRKVLLAASLVALWRREAAASAPELMESTLRATDRAVEPPLAPSPTSGSTATTPPPGRFPTSGWAGAWIGALAILIATLAAATTLGAIVHLSPSGPASDSEADDLPANLTDLLNSDCS